MRILAKTEQAPAVEHLGELPLSEDAREHLKEGQSSRQFLDVLVSYRLYEDGILVLAHGLPKRHAVKWACDCVRFELEPANEEETICLEAAETWVTNPTDEQLQQARIAAAASNYDSPSAWLAFAAGFSGGTLDDWGGPDELPDEGLTGHAIAGSLGLVASAIPKKHKKRLLSCVKRGLVYADLRNRG